MIATPISIKGIIIVITVFSDQQPVCDHAVVALWSAAAVASDGFVFQLTGPALSCCGEQHLSLQDHSSLLVGHSWPRCTDSGKKLQHKGTDLEMFNAHNVTPQAIAKVDA